MQECPWYPNTFPPRGPARAGLPRTHAALSCCHQPHTEVSLPLLGRSRCSQPRERRLCRRHLLPGTLSPEPLALTCDGREPPRATATVQRKQQSSSPCPAQHRCARSSGTAAGGLSTPAAQPQASGALSVLPQHFFPHGAGELPEGSTPQAPVPEKPCRADWAQPGPGQAAEQQRGFACARERDFS